MKRQTLFFSLIFIFISPVIFSQNFLITEPKLQFDGFKLSISYDLVAKNQSDIYYVWVEMRNQAGSPIRTASFKGEVGDSITPGNNKLITWVPEIDAIFLDEDITVEIKGELYMKSFNKGSMLLLSALVPGLGQTKINNGKPWWLTSIPVYGAFAGGIINHSNYMNTYDAYLSESDQIERQDLYDKSQQQKNLSNSLFVSAAALWVGNIVWMAATPNKYKPLQHVKFSVSSVQYNDHDRITLLSFKLNF